MAITLTIYSRKPAGTTFYGDVSADNKAKATAHDVWTSQQPGFVSQHYENTDENTKVYTVVFDTVENYAAWHSARLTRPLATERSAYNASIGLTTLSNETVS